MANLLEELGYHVRTNRAYSDPEEPESREIDVWAIRREFHDTSQNRHVFVELLCECKNTAHTLAFLGRPKNRADAERAPEEFRFTASDQMIKVSDEGGGAYANQNAFLYLALGQHHYAFASGQKCTQFCRLERKSKGWVAEHGPLYGSILLPLIKALRARQEEVRPAGRQGHAWLWFPLVIVTSPLVLVDTSVNPPKVNDINYVTLMREVQSGVLKGVFSIDFVQVSWLKGFLEHQIGPFVSRVVQFAREEPDRLFGVSA